MSKDLNQVLNRAPAPPLQKYQCTHCDKRCSNTADLREHLRKHEEPKFKCSYCEKMLKRKSALLEHERMHTGEKPYR